MDKNSRLDQLLDLLGTQKGLRDHLVLHQAKVASHHDSPERARALRHAEGALRRLDKTIRSLERAVRSQQKDHQSHVQPSVHRAQ